MQWENERYSTAAVMVSICTSVWEMIVKRSNADITVSTAYTNVISPLCVFARIQLPTIHKGILLKCSISIKNKHTHTKPHKECSFSVLKQKLNGNILYFTPDINVNKEITTSIICLTPRTYHCVCLFIYFLIRSSSPLDSHVL